MSKYNLLYLLLVLGFIACNNAPQRPAPILPEGYTPTETTNANPNIPPPTSAEPAQNAAGVWHYTCPNGCAGGAGSAIACPNGCGATLAHNAAYHNSTGGSISDVTANPSSNKTTIATSTNGVITPTPGAPITSTSTNPEPAQNAKGVWHYTCPNGCAGGGGSASLCANGCGATLAHNAAYHQ